MSPIGLYLAPVLGDLVQPIIATLVLVVLVLVGTVAITLAV